MLTRNRYTTFAAMILVVTSTIDCGQGLIVGSRRPFIQGHSRRRTQSSSSSMKMYINDMMPLTSVDMPVLPPTAASFDIVRAASRLISSDPEIEVEILNDISHVALDASTFLSPNTAWLRLCNVIGRVLILSSDYIQSDVMNITPDEWVFETIMLAISTQLFLKSAAPLMLAVFSSALSVRDRRAYYLLFEAVGLTILQFKSLIVSKTFDWVEYEPNETVELDGEYMYFLYSGEAGKYKNKDTITLNIGASSSSRLSIQMTEKSSESSISKREEGSRIGNRIFGDVQFAEALEAAAYERTKKKSKKGTAKMTQETNSTSTSQARSFVVGSTGASMLRISTSKLLKLMKDDNELTNSIQRLVLLCMQEKLSKQEEGLKLTSTKAKTTRMPNATRVIPANV